MTSSLGKWIQLLSLASLLALACASCGTLGGPASASFASVVIKGRTADEIARTASQVFTENGFMGGGMPDRMEFTKEGSRKDDIAYGSLGSGMYGTKTQVRVKAEVVSLGSDSHRLQCEAFMVRAAGDAFFQEEQRLSNFRRGPYQAILNETARRLK